jgi:hypothetical protein
MGDYGVNDALEDLDALEGQSLSADQRVAASLRIRCLLKELQRASVLVDDGS